MKVLAEPYLPVELSDAQLAFPAHALDWMPRYEDIPDEFRQDYTNQWRRFQRRMFYEGLPGTTEFWCKDGIDGATAFRHIHAIQGSYAPKHEHKEAAVAFLCSLWFDGIKVSDDEIYGEVPDGDANVGGDATAEGADLEGADGEA